ncbi:MAG: hypothetical protein H7346_19735 [Burkholderiaceae bacterium]|nr:hypothetical protein [Burkholderiaceae bacterium]
MESDKQDNNADGQQNRRPLEQVKKDGFKGQIGNLEVLAGQDSDAQLNQDQGNTGSKYQSDQPGNSSTAASNNPQQSRKASDIEQKTKKADPPASRDAIYFRLASDDLD